MGQPSASAERPSAAEVCGQLRKDLKEISTEEPGAPDGEGAMGDLHKCSENVEKQLQLMSEVFQDTAERGSDQQSRDLVLEFLSADLPANLVVNLSNLEFEVRKFVIKVLGQLLRIGKKVGVEQQITEYGRNSSSFFSSLVKGYLNSEIAAHCGMMLRSCAEHRGLVEAFFNSEGISRLMEFVRDSSFDISSDAFSTLHNLLLNHKSVSAAYLAENFASFFKIYNGLLQECDYVTKRQALKLLSEMLLDRSFMKVMFNYIGDDKFLQIHMNLLREDSKIIQMGAFHVFKIFVANPQKKPKVQQILYNNKIRLIKRMESLTSNLSDDRAFSEDKQTVIHKLRTLEPVLGRSLSDKTNTAPSGDTPIVDQIDTKPR